MFMRACVCDRVRISKFYFQGDIVLSINQSICSRVSLRLSNERIHVTKHISRS